MTKQKQKKILILALYAGEIMMKSGAEIYRVEDTITRICKACNIPYVEVFVTPTGIFVSLDKGGEDNEMFTFIKRIRGTGIDLLKIAETNQFSRDFVNNDLSIEKGMERLKEISQTKSYPMIFRVLGSALACAFFSVLFQANTQDFFCAFFVGALSYILSICFDGIETNYFVKGFCCTAFAAFLALLCTAIGIGSNSGPITIGALMLFVPGVAITNAIRDFLVGDMLSGLARTAEAFFVAVSLAAGAGVVLKLWVALGGVII